MLECILPLRCWIKCCQCDGAFCVPGLLTRGRGGFTRVPNAGAVTPEAGYQSVLFTSQSLVNHLNHHAPLVLRRDLHLQHAAQPPEFIKISCSRHQILVGCSWLLPERHPNIPVLYKRVIGPSMENIPPSSLAFLHLRCFSLSEASQTSSFLFSKGSTFWSICRPKVLCK